MNIQHVLFSIAWGLVFPVSADGNRIGCWNRAQREAERKLAFLNRIDDLTDAAQLSLDPPLSCCMEKEGVATSGLEHNKHKLLVAGFHCPVTSSQDWLPCGAMAITFPDPEASAVVIWTRVAEPNVVQTTVFVVLSTKVIGTADKKAEFKLA